MFAPKPHLLNLFVVLALLLPGPAQLTTTQKPLVSSSAPAPVNSAPALKPDFGKLPLYFIENQGQLDERVAYYIQGTDKTIYFTPEGVTFALSRAAPTVGDDSHDRLRAYTLPARWVVKLDFVGANPNVRPVGQDPTEAVISYFMGKPDQWHTGLHTYARIVYSDLWPGIDLVYYGTVNQLKYEFVVKPGADPAQIRLAYRGATSAQVNAVGQLEVTTPLGGFHDDTPVAYQDVDGRRVGVAIAYALDEGRDDPADRLLAGAGDAPVGAGDAPPERLYGFRVGDYDPTRPLMLDPAVLVYAGYLGGAGSDPGYGIAVDGSGNAYVTGLTTSDQTTFPVTGGPDLTYNGRGDAFVAKVNAAGTALVYAGYLGGTSDDYGYGIAVDGERNAYVTGYTVSDQATFPVTGGPDLTLNGGGDAFVAKVNAAGTALVYAGYLGGTNSDFGYDIAVDGAGNAYVTGYTVSDQATFPVTGGPDLTYNGSYDAFVAKVNAAGTALIYAGYLGGASDDYGFSIAVDGAGSVYVTGQTGSDQATFPVTGGPDLTLNGIYNAFVAKVNTAGTALVYAGYIGGTSGDRGNDIAVDGAGNAYVTGATFSDQATFPVTGGPDLTFNGGYADAFVAKVNAAGTTLVYAGYIGGAGSDGGSDIAVDGAGNVYVTGSTLSDQTTFPVTGGPDLTLNGGEDAFVAKVNAAGTVLVYAGYIGGIGVDRGNGIAVDGAGNAYVTGYTTSDQATFPVTGGPDLTYNGYEDAFVAKVNAAGGGTTRTPVVFIPGLMGSRLFNTVNGQEQEVWANICNILFSNLNELELAADGATPARNDPAYTTIHTKPGTPGVIDRLKGSCLGIEVDQDFYDTLIKHFQTFGYTENVDFWVYTYDWRKDLRTSANGLDTLIQSILSQTGASQVYIVAHSLGGLLTRQYISDSTRAAGVKQAVILGTPFLGTPKAFNVLLNGDCLFDIKEKIKLISYCVPRKQVIKALAPNFLAFYEIMPSQAYFTLKGGGFYGVNLSEADIRDICPECLGFDQTYAISTASNLNVALSNSARQFHTSLDNLTNWNGVDVDIIGGKNKQTIVGIRQHPRWSWRGIQIGTVREPVFSPAGDGTVALLSVSLVNPATGTNLLGPASFRVFDADHMALVQNSEILQYVDILLGLSSSSLSLEAAAAVPDATGAQIVAYGVNSIHVHDALGNHTGPITYTEFIEQAISGSAYFSDQDMATVALIGGQTYTITVMPSGDTPVDITLVRSTLTETLTSTLFLGITVTSQSLIRMVGDPYSVDTWEVDMTGTGTNFQPIAPTTVITSGTTIDTEPPTTTISLQGPLGPNGWYLAPVTVTLTASDVGSGVCRIEYAFSNDRQVRVYTEPFVVSPDAVGVVYARAVDHFGNEQVTVSQARIGPDKLYLPLVRR